MKRNLVGLMLGLAAILGLSCSSTEPEKSGGGATAPAASTPEPQAMPERIPPYHESAEAARPFPKLLSPALFEGNSEVSAVYAMARNIPGVLAQQPCYCYCDRFGHGSLLDCFASDHGAG